MEFLQRENQIYLENESGEVIAHVDFVPAGEGVYNIEHTVVDTSLRGQNIASLLVERAVEAIHRRGAKVAASCSYAAKWLEREGIKE